MQEARCHIFHDRFGYWVQALVGTVAMGTLLLKWQTEKPRRRLPDFLCDSSKQIVGQGVMHLLNMVCAVLFASKADECAWYWVNVVLGATVGTLLAYTFLKASERLFGYASGNYGEANKAGADIESRPGFNQWLMQITIWVGILSVMKLIVVAIMLSFSGFWTRLSMAATLWIQDGQMRLLFVMVATPAVMNTLQVLTMDNFLKFSEKPPVIDA